MYNLNNFSFSWITGFMIGLEILFGDETDDIEIENGKFLFGFAIDLGIVRMVYHKFRMSK